MAARRNPKPRRTSAAATPKPAVSAEAAPLASPVQSQAAEAAAEALIAAARTKADDITNTALAAASTAVRAANAKHDKLLSAAERAAEALQDKANGEAERLLVEASTEAARLRQTAKRYVADAQAEAQLAAERIEGAAEGRAAAVQFGAREEADEVLAAARRRAERVMADANRYAEARMGQAMTTARELQEQAVADTVAARQLREQADEFKAEAAELQAAALQKLADACTRTAKKIHRQGLRAQARRERKERRGPKPGAVQLTPIHRFLIGLIVFGAASIAAIGFTGSYGAVRDLAVEKGFGDFAGVLPIGIDAGIGVLLALDLLLTWLRMSMPMLRHAAWILTGATVWFNAAASWPDPLGVGLHMAMPVLFVIVVEAARHAIGRIADIEAKEHTETPKLIRWALAFRSTWRLWRRQQVWTVRDLNVAIADEGERLVYIRSLQSKYKIRAAHTRKGLGWRQQATEAELRPLDLYDTGVPFADALQRQEGPTPATGRPTEAPTTSLAKSSDPADNSVRQESPTVDDRNRQKTVAKKPTPVAKTTPAKSRQKPIDEKPPRRSMTEWVALTEPIFHAEFKTLKRNPTASEFADAIKKAGHGRPSDSTAKNIRTEILDRAELPALDD